MVDEIEVRFERRRSAQSLNGEGLLEQTLSLWPDSLTGRELTDLVESRLVACRPGEVCGLLIGGLDRADLIGEAYGTSVAARVLDDLIGRIGSMIRSDDVVSRFGADGYIVLIGGVAGCRDLELVAQRIVMVARQSTALPGDADHRVTTAVGLAVAYSSQATSATLSGSAIGALGLARAQGGDRFVVSQPASGRGASHQSARVRLEVEADLRRAIERAEIQLACQAIHRVGSGHEADRFEALIRWHHPQRGLIHPSSFLPWVSEAGLAGPVTELLLDEVTRQIQNQSERVGRAAVVAIDLAPSAVATDLPEQLNRRLSRAGVAPGQLELELDLAALTSGPEGGPEALSGVLSQLALMGVGLTADHVEGSLGALTMLRSRPVLTSWKLDRSLAEGLDRSASPDGPDYRLARAGVEALVALAAEMGVEVIALGVGGTEVAQDLEGLGVGFLQGLGVQRPQRSMT